MYALMSGSMKFRNMTQLVRLLQSHCQSTCVRCARASAAALSTSTKLQYPRMTQFVEPGVSFNPETLPSWEKMKWNMGFFGKMAFSNRHLFQSSFRLYICCTDFVDFGTFVKEFDRADDFMRWFIITTLHVWIVSVKLMQMGREGFLMKQYLYVNMWQDVEKRLKTFKDLPSSERKEQLKNMASHNITLNLYLDEGIIGSDTTLANALWLSVFEKDMDMAPDKLALMVEYVRKQVFHQDRLEAAQLMSMGYVSFLPLHGTRVDKEKETADFFTLEKLKYE